MTRRPRAPRRAAALALVAALAAGALAGCADSSALRHESATLPTRNILPVDPAGEGNEAIGPDVRAQLRELLLGGDTLSLASDKPAAQAVLQRLKGCSADCVLVSPPVTVNNHRYLLASVPSGRPTRPGAAFAFLDDGPAPRLALVVTGYDVFLGAGEKGTLVAMAGSTSDAEDPLTHTVYKVGSDGRLSSS